MRSWTLDTGRQGGQITYHHCQQPATSIDCRLTRLTISPLYATFVVFPEMRCAVLCVGLLLCVSWLWCCCVRPCTGWVQLSPFGGSISARRGHSAITVGDRWLVVFGGRSVDVLLLTDSSATSPSVSNCFSIGGCHEEVGAGTCNGCSVNNSVSCACSCSTGFSGVNCEFESVDVWLSSVSVWDMQNVSGGWLSVDCDPAGTVSPVAWPAARYHHSAALFGAEVMLVYGGYSQLCGDFCSDLWQYDMADTDSKGRGTWTEIAPADSSNFPGK